MKLVIDRAKWLRGETDLRSYLLREADGKMCCLGFLALACGAEVDDICSYSSPKDTHNVSWPDGLLGDMDCKQNTEVCGTLMNINDRVSDEEREIRLTEEFKKLDIEVEFIGE